MRPAEKRLVRVPAAAAALAIASSATAAWATWASIDAAMAVVVTSRLLASLIFRLDRLPWRRLTFRDATTAGLACAGGSALAAALSTALPGAWPLRLLAVDAAIYPCILFGLAAIPLLRELRAKPVQASGVRTLIWGAGADGRALLERIRREGTAIEVYGWLDDDPVLAELDCDGLPVLGPLESLPLLVELHGVQTVLVAVPSLSAERRAFAEDLARWSGAELVFAPTFASGLQALAAEASARETLTHARR